MGAHDDVVKMKSSHDGNQQATACHDYPRAFQRKPRVVHSLGKRFGGQGAKHVFGGGPSEHHAVQTAGIIGTQAQFDCGDGHDAAGHTHHTAGFAKSRVFDHRVVDRVSHDRNGIGEFFGARRVAVQFGFGVGHHAIRQRHTVAHDGTTIARVADGEFGRSTANVDHHRDAIDWRQARHCALPCQSCLVAGRQQPWVHTRDAVHLGKKISSVGGHTTRRGAGDGQLCCVLAHQSRILRDHSQRARHCRSSKHATCSQTFAERGDIHFAHQFHPVGIDNQQVGGVRPNINGGKCCVRHDASLAATQRPTGSSLPTNQLA